MFELYSYFRSSAAYRVRIALGLKGLNYTTVPVHLLRDGGEQLSARYLAINPEGLVPALADGSQIITQSLAIIEYLDEAYSPASLLPQAPLERARVRALALHIACDIHPLNNLRVLRYLSHQAGLGLEARNDWYRHWIVTGFQALEKQLAHSPDTGLCCHGDQPGLADCCLIPQVFNAQRYEVDLGPFPTIARIATHCETHPAFQAAHPARQPDAE
uniref:maleylacetoacetate isomerase n=1 Tax=Castellaniella defragrans TaxID=75697 RepID=UPI003342DB88